jgi:hypothetical protein
MQTDVFRCEPNDPNSRKKLDTLLGEFGVCLHEEACNFPGQLIENLLWRKIAPTGEGHEGTALHVFLDLGEGDEVLLATLRAGEINAFSHAELYAP